MAWIQNPELRERLPLEGDGLLDSVVDEAIASAIDEVTGICGTESAGSALAESAVASFAHADLLDIIFPRDAREPGNEGSVLRSSAERKISRYLEIAQSDKDPSTADVPPIVISASGPMTYQVPDETY